LSLGSWCDAAFARIGAPSMLSSRGELNKAAHHQNLMQRARPGRLGPAPEAATYRSRLGVSIAPAWPAIAIAAAAPPHLLEGQLAIAVTVEPPDHPVERLAELLGRDQAVAVVVVR